MFKYLKEVYNIMFNNKKEEIVKPDELQSIKDAIRQASLSGECSIDLCNIPQRYILDELLHSGYNISIHEIKDSSYCYDYNGIKSVVRTKIYW